MFAGLAIVTMNERERKKNKSRGYALYFYNETKFFFEIYD
jgi:hypothetical protein